MGEKPLDKEALQAQYDQLRPKYEQLEARLKQDVRASLDNRGIKVLTIESRTKDIESFWGKAQRRHYENPLHDMPDLCGLRIICYYPADVDLVCQVVADNLDVIESVAKEDSQKPEEFGYLSRHFIVTPKEHWLRTPRYDGLHGLKAEIQVRTIFQHAWADLSHDLLYKKEKHVPTRFRRRLYQLSAILENLDDQFNALHEEKSDYGRVVAEEAEARGRFDTDQEVNIDTLQAFLDFYFPTRDRGPEQMAALLDHIMRVDISMLDLVEGFEKVSDILPRIEREEMYAKVDSGEIGQLTDAEPWPQPKALNTVLQLTNDDYVRYYYELLPSTVADAILSTANRWRLKLADEGE